MDTAYPSSKRSSINPPEGRDVVTKEQHGEGGEGCAYTLMSVSRGLVCLRCSAHQK